MFVLESERPYNGSEDRLFVYLPILKKKSVAPVEHMANRQVF